MTTLRSYLVSVAMLLVLLICAAAAVLTLQVERFGREQSERQLLGTTRALSLVVDGELRRYEAILDALRGSEALERQDWQRFDARARALLASPGTWIVLIDRSGRQLVNTRLPAGAPLPSGRLDPAIWRLLDTGRTHYCKLSRGLLEPRILCVDVPVMRAGRAAYMLSVVMRPDQLRTITDRQHLDGGNIGTIIDQKGIVIWRNQGAERFVGKPARPELLNALTHAAEAVQEGTSLEGVPTVVAFSRSALSGWTVIVAVPRNQIRAGAHRALAWGAGGAFLLLLLGGLTGLMAARRVTGAVARLNEAAGRIGAGDSPRFQPSGIGEIDAAGRALEAAIGARDLSEERFDLAQEVGGIGAWDWDVVNDLGRVSDSYKRMHGLGDRPGPLRTADVRARIHPDDLQDYVKRIEEARGRSEPSINEYRVIHPDGGIRWIAAKGRPIYDEAGNYVRAVGIVRDVTAEHEADRALRESERRYRRLFEQSSDLIVTADLDQVITDCNPSAAAAVGLTREQAIGRRIADFLSADDFEQTSAMLHRKMSAGGTTRYDVRVRSTTGELLFWEINSGLTHDGDGVPVGLHVVARDVTERKRAEEHQRLLINELNHRVKNTLSVVQSIARQTLRGVDAAGVREALEGRLGALSAAHDLLTRQSWADVEMRTIIAGAIGPFCSSARCALDGPDLRINPKTAVNLALAVHELATNASKYGALSNEEGHVSIIWSVGDRLSLTWREQGGPPVAVPTRTGFGTRMLERGLAAELGGSVTLDYCPDGLCCTIDAPLPAAG